MKSADTKTDGTLYYANAANGWQRGDGYESTRLTVLDNRGWRQGTTSYWNRDKGDTWSVQTMAGPLVVSRQIKLRTKGDTPSNRFGDTDGVLAVRVTEKGLITGRPFVVAPQHIRGTWAECKAKREAYDLARREAAERSAEAYRNNKTRATALAERFGAAGFSGVAHTLDYSYGKTSISVTLSDLERLVALIETTLEG